MSVTTLLAEAYNIIDQLNVLALPDHPHLYAQSQRWKEVVKSILLPGTIKPTKSAYDDDRR